MAADRLGSPDRPTLSECRISPESYVKMCMEIWCHEIVAPPRAAPQQIWCALWKRRAHVSSEPTVSLPFSLPSYCYTTRPTDLPRAARRSKFWVGSTDRPTLFGPAGAQCASRPTRPTDPLCAAGGAKYDSDHPTDRPSLRLAGDAERLINFAPPKLVYCHEALHLKQKLCQTPATRRRRSCGTPTRTPATRSRGQTWTPRTAWPESPGSPGWQRHRGKRS